MFKSATHPQMPQCDCRDGGLLRFCAAEIETARRVRRDVLATRGPVLGTLAAGAMPIADRVSRRWLERSGDPYREELATISALVGRPGVTALNLSYEWGCTSLAFETEGVPRLTRVLDWPYHGLGRRVAAVDLQGPAGSFTVLTWPGVSSVLQASAPGRFAAALNQAPEPRSGRGSAHDWLAAKRRFLKSRGMLPGHLLRLVFETAPDFSEARRMLAETPVCVPAIYTIAGTRPGEGCVIERLETAARIQPMQSGSAAAANHWKSDLGASGDWRSRGNASEARADLAPSDLAAWHRTGELHAPIANATTRLVMSAVPATGSLVAQGWESDGPVTALTTLAA